MSFQCPNCGRQLKVIPLSASVPVGDWDKREMRQYAIGADVPPGVEYERTQPISQMSVKSYVVTPLAWSFVAALLLTLGASVVVALSLGSRMPLPLWSPIIVFIVVLILAWFSRSDIATKLLYVTERITGQDLNGDDAVGQPQELRIEVTEPKPGGGRMQFLTIEDVDADTLRYWARAVSGGDTLGVGRWVGRGAPFTRTQYDRMMSEFTRAGLIVDHGGNIGRRPTAAGRNIFKELGQ